MKQRKKDKSKIWKGSISKDMLSQYCSLVKPHIEKVTNDLGYKTIKILFVSENNINCLRATISHVGHNISHTDCELVSKEIEKELDKKDLIPFSYALEIESPGIAYEKPSELVLNSGDTLWSIRTA